MKRNDPVSLERRKARAALEKKARHGSRPAARELVEQNRYLMLVPSWEEPHQITTEGIETVLSKRHWDDRKEKAA